MGLGFEGSVRRDFWVLCLMSCETPLTLLDFLAYPSNFHISPAQKSALKLFAVRLNSDAGLVGIFILKGKQALLIRLLSSLGDPSASSQLHA